MSAKKQILVTAPLLPSADAILDENFVVHRLWEQADQDGYLAAVAGHIRGLATSTAYRRIDGTLLERLPYLEIVASFGVGYDHVDAEEAARRGIVVTNTPGVLDEEVADLALGLTLATLRQIPQADRFVRNGQWPAGSFPLSASLRGRRVGIVGMGRIGKAIARRFDAFLVPVAYHARSEQPGVDMPFYDSLTALAAASDVLVVIVPGGAATKGLINAAVLEALGPHGVLINVARGSVVDEQALIAALESRIISGAGLDVFEDEPHVPAKLVAMDQVVLLPHIGSATVHTRNAMARLVADNLVAWLSGRGALTPVPESSALCR